MPRKTGPGRTVMVLLQCQWFNDPARARQVLSTYITLKGDPGWNRFVRDMLFMGCLTGNRIRDAFGEDFCWDSVVAGRVVFEETSKDMGDRPSAVFPPDPKHLVASVRYHRPGLVVALGRVAAQAMEIGEVVAELPVGCKIVWAPHPAARGPDTMDKLRRAAASTWEWIQRNP